jgi:hypothetical protein
MDPWTSGRLKLFEGRRQPRGGFEGISVAIGENFD